MPIQQTGGDYDGDFFPGGNQKASGPPSGPPGGGPPGGVGGPGGFGGLRPNIFQGLGSVRDGQLPILLRKRGLRVPGVTPGAPGKSDTVPAMLTPGEMVMNRGVTQNPELMDFLMQLNQQGAASQGAQGYEDGGMVPDEGGAVSPESPALRFIRLLLSLDDGGVEGFAYGGVAGAGPFGQNLPTTGWSRFGTHTLGPARPAGGSPFGSPAPVAAPGAPPMTRDSEGNVTNFNPQSPWAGLQGNQNAFGLGLLYRGIGNAGAAGAFDPGGNQQLINQQIEAAQGTKDALVRRQMTAADLNGLDPAQAAVARQQALRETGRGVQDIAANVRAGAADRAQSFNEDLYRQATQGGIGYSLNEQQGRNERIAQNNAGRNANQAGGGWLGQTVGGAIGGWAGGGFKRPFGGK